MTKKLSPEERATKIALSLEKRKEQFLLDAKNTHGTRYDYSYIEYKNALTKVTIICPEHGEFLQTPSTHINSKHGCPQCSYIAGGIKNCKRTTADFIVAAKQVHGETYDYSMVDYVQSHSKVTIICPTHGEFNQTPNNHLRGQGCPDCGKKYSSLIRTYTTEEFIERAKVIHGDRYDYSNSIYVGHQSNIEIICKKHGSFFQQPSNHLHISAPTGCPICFSDLGGLFGARNFNTEEEKNAPALLYVCRLFSETEEFFKVGITTKSVQQRFSSIPYQFEVIYEFETTLYKAFTIEQRLLSMLPVYYPATYFSGVTEARESLLGLREKDIYEMLVMVNEQ